jgi:hypothetical protein
LTALSQGEGPWLLKSETASELSVEPTAKEMA